MRTIAIALLGSLLLALAGCSSGSGDSRKTAPEVVSAAQASLATLHQLRSADRTTGGVLGEGLLMYMIRLDSLRAYRSGDDPKSLLNETGRIMYPVTVGGEVRSSVTMEKRAGVWQPAAFGYANLARMVHTTRQQVVDATQTPLESVVYVEAPAVGARFVGHEAGSTLILTPIHDIAGTTLTAGKLVSATEALAQLSRAAQDVAN
jgi:hypothetical protein